MVEQLKNLNFKLKYICTIIAPDLKRELFRSNRHEDQFANQPISTNRTSLDSPHVISRIGRNRVHNSVLIAVKKLYQQRKRDVYFSFNQEITYAKKVNINWTYVPETVTTRFSLFAH